MRFAPFDWALGGRRPGRMAWRVAAPIFLVLAAGAIFSPSSGRLSTALVSPPPHSGDMLKDISNSPGRDPGPHGSTAESREDPGDSIAGIVEAIPQNVFHATPYNDWPLFEIRVREGQRLKFNRERGAWSGDIPALFIQFETPAEIDGKKEDVEIAALEKAAAQTSLDILRTELQKELDGASIRERNARQQHERLERLLGRGAATQEDLQRARNTLDLAVSQREQVEALLGKKLELAGTQADLARHRLLRAESELQLADFKREMSWGNVPVARGRFEEVVVTKVHGVRGDVPTAASRRDAWIEVIDDRVLNVRSYISAGRTRLLAVGQEAVVHQEGRQYEGLVAGVGIVADARTRLVPILIEVQNADRGLKINTAVTVGIGTR